MIDYNQHSTQKKISHKGSFIVLRTILIVLLILFLIGALPHWSYSQEWGYTPFGGLTVILIVVIILALLGII